ncbi:MAG TPA: hypothetical protein VGN26_01765 [Armatimonadota bacterium]
MQGAEAAMGRGLNRSKLKALLALACWAGLSACGAQAGAGGPYRVPVRLVPSMEATGETQTVSFGLPLPPGLLQSTDLVAVTDSGGKEIPAHVKSLGPWRSIPPGSLLPAGLPKPQKPGIRSVLIQISRTFTDVKPETVTVELGTRRTQDVAQEVPVRSTWRLAKEGTYGAEDGVREPKVYALLPSEWLAASGIVPLGTPSAYHGFLSAFDRGQIDFFSTAINDTGPKAAPDTRIPYKTDNEPWLYDRAQAFLNGYLRTGRLEFLREGHRAAQHYASLLYTDADKDPSGKVPPEWIRGFFRLKSPVTEYYKDGKYSYAECLATDYWLTGDDSLLPRIADVASALKTSVPLTQPFTGDYATAAHLAWWTERHWANGLLGVVVAYEVTGDRGLPDYLRKSIDAFWQLQNHPLGGKPVNGAFNHYVTEGGTDVLSFSPWMSSLLAYALLRAYFTLGEPRIPAMLAGLAQAEVDRALYTATFEGEGSFRIPRYVAASYGDPKALDKENDPETDREHSIDVAYVTALGALFTQDAEQRKSLVEATRSLLVSNEAVLKKWTRAAGWPGNGQPLYRLNPPRKYAWWFKNAGGVGWALGGPTILPPPDNAPAGTVSAPQANSGGG